MASDLPAPTLVQDELGLEGLLEALEGEREIAVDTEADSFFNYREKVCLIQLTAGGVDYLLDPLAEIDIRPLGEVLADPERVKVFHDGEYDVLILKRDYGFRFAALFDTRVAASALGIEHPGLASVLNERFGIELDKSMQRSNWSQRPLSAKQVDYARLDTHFLIALMRDQQAELEELGRTMIVEGECRRLEQLAPVEAHFDPDEFIRIKGARKLAPIELQRLRSLFILRDELARERDQPPFRVLNSSALLNLAQRAPARSDELGGIRGFPARHSRSMGERVLRVLEEARRLGPLKRLPEPRSRDGTGGWSELDLEVHEALKQWRKERARREGYDSSLVLNRLVLLRLARGKPRALEEVRATEGILPWQVEAFGDEVIEAVARAIRAYRKNGGRRSSRGRRR